jgi:hypothetical protein
MTTTAIASVPVPVTARAATTPGRHHLVLPRARGLAAAAGLVAALSIPVTGAGSAIGAPHAPSLTSTVAATDALTTPVSVGKLHV